MDAEVEVYDFSDLGGISSRDLHRMGVRYERMDAYECCKNYVWGDNNYWGFKVNETCSTCKYYEVEWLDGYCRIY